MLTLFSLSPTLALPKSPDIILSSGFLCFSSHAGALQALALPTLTPTTGLVLLQAITTKLPIQAPQIQRELVRHDGVREEYRIAFDVIASQIREPAYLI